MPLTQDFRRNLARARTGRSETFMRCLAINTLWGWFSHCGDCHISWVFLRVNTVKILKEFVIEFFKNPNINEYFDIIEMWFVTNISYAHRHRNVDFGRQIQFAKIKKGGQSQVSGCAARGVMRYPGAPKYFLVTLKFFSAASGALHLQCMVTTKSFRARGTLMWRRARGQINRHWRELKRIFRLACVPGSSPTRVTVSCACASRTRGKIEIL